MTDDEPARLSAAAERRDQLEQAREYFGPGPGGLAYLRREATEATIRRLVTNRRKNLRKSRCIVIGYWVLLPALPIILFSLGWLAHKLV